MPAFSITTRPHTARSVSDDQKDQRQAEGRYFAEVVPPVQLQLIEPPDGTVPAASAAPPEVGTIIKVPPPAAEV